MDLEEVMEACGKQKTAAVQSMCDEMLILAATTDKAGYYDLRKKLGKRRMQEEQRGFIDERRDETDALKTMQNR